MRKLNTTMRTKLVTGGIFLVLVPVLIVGTLSVEKASEALIAASETEALQVAKGVAKSAQMALADNLKMAELLATDATVLAAAGEFAKASNASQEILDTLQERLRQFSKQLGKDYENIMYIDPQGKVRADGVDGASGYDVSDREYFKAGREGRSIVSKILKSKRSGNAIVSIATPVRDRAGTFEGAIMIAMSMEFFMREVTNARVGKTGYAFLVDGGGLCIAHMNRDLILTNNIRELRGMEKIAGKALARQEGTEAYSFHGKKKIAGFAPVEISGWSVITTQDADEFLAPARSIQNGILLTAIILLAFSFIVVFLLSRKLSRPISDVVSGLGIAAAHILLAANQAAAAGRQLAEGASEQAAAIEQTSSSLEQMASTTKRNAGNAVHANRLMDEAKGVVSGANQSMTQLTSSMDEISQASEKTQKIIKTIDEIAFQTNLLALNAAVEAARAGEAGAGFAVVADEVRSLAMRAAEAAKSTAALIEGTVNRIRHGSELVVKTNVQFANVADIVLKSSELVGEISAASQEQSQGIEQANKAMNEMDRVVQQNAANAEETASSSLEMDVQVKRMNGFVHELQSLVGGAKGNSDESGKAVKNEVISARSKRNSWDISSNPAGTSRRHPGGGPTLSGGRKTGPKPEFETAISDEDF